jgi:hypothetical protein
VKHATAPGPYLPCRKGTYQQLKEAKDFAFVVTDIESSTELSQQDPEAFRQVVRPRGVGWQAVGRGGVGGSIPTVAAKLAGCPPSTCLNSVSAFPPLSLPTRLQLQEIHDHLMRECIAKHSGYEIITEGDSFSIAFTTVASAAACCMEFQWRLLHANWPSRVLRLNACRPISRERACEQTYAAMRTCCQQPPATPALDASRWHALPPRTFKPRCAFHPHRLPKGSHTFHLLPPNLQTLRLGR